MIIPSWKLSAVKYQAGAVAITKLAANSRGDIATRGFVEEALPSVNIFWEVGLLLSVVQVGGAVSPCEITASWYRFLDLL